MINPGVLKLKKKKYFSFSHKHIF